METPDSRKKNKKNSRRTMPRLTRKKLDHFLSSLCEEAGMSGKPSGNKTAGGSHGLVCRAPCRKADWRAHLDIPAGILCVSAAWSANKQAAKHRDVTIAITFLDDDGKPDYADIVFCDSEIRWLMETLWHAPLWDEDR